MIRKFFRWIFYNYFEAEVKSILEAKESDYTVIGQKENLIIGEKTKIGKNVVFECKNGKITIGNHCHIQSDVKIMCYGGNIKIGNEVSVNPNSILYGHGGLKIGNYVRIAAATIIIPSNHVVKDREVPIYQQGLISKGIEIEDDVWLGSNVKVLDDVHIAKGVVVGAGSVVTKSLNEPYGIYVGVPAKFLNFRDA